MFHIVIIAPNFLIKYANCELPHNYKAQQYNYVIKSFYETFVGKRELRRELLSKNKIGAT